MSCLWCLPFRLRQRPKPTPSFPPPDSEDGGFKVLYEGAGAIGVDIIAVHGLNGHRERSWTAANGTNWLRDLLPTDMPGIRVASWGWKLATTADSPGTTSQQLAAEKLILDLWKLRSATNTSNRPIIFIAHSAGGLLVKSALLYSQSTAEDSTIDLHSIASSTSGAIFLGTTELDSRLEGLQSYLASAQGSGQESSEVYQEALWLIHTLQKFPLIGENIWTLSVHERPGSSHAEVKWDEGRGSHILVQTGHDEMIKFDRVCEGYLQIKEHLMFVDLKAEIDA